jgi:DNA-binding NarL/FixJ family response regulator
VRRHADAAHAIVRLRLGADALEVSIEDDGSGGTTAAKSAGHGLRGIRERAAMLGGAVNAGTASRVPRQRDPALPGVTVRHRLRVIIADDQPLLRAGFRSLLESAGDIEIVAEASTGEQAIGQARRHLPDVVLMDIRMPGMDGIEATRQLTRTRVLILTAFGLDEYIIQALRAGASGFILKDTRVEDLLHAVRTVAAGEAFLSPAVTRQLLNQVARWLPASVDRRPAQLAALTDRSSRYCGVPPPDSATPRSPPR